MALYSVHNGAVIEIRGEIKRYIKTLHVVFKEDKLVSNQSCYSLKARSQQGVSDCCWRPML